MTKKVIGMIGMDEILLKMICRVINKKTVVARTLKKELDRERVN